MSDKMKWYEILPLWITVVAYAIIIIQGIRLWLADPRFEWLVP